MRCVCGWSLLLLLLGALHPTLSNDLLVGTLHPTTYDGLLPVGTLHPTTYDGTDECFAVVGYSSDDWVASEV